MTPSSDLLNERIEGASETYAFDEVDRLTQAVYPNGTHESFPYDPVGNRLTRTDQSGTITTSSYDVANQMLTSGSTSFTYDANGSLIRKAPSTGNPTTYTYDAANRLTQISAPEGSESNLYAPDGTRIEIASPTVGGAVRPLYDLSGNPILEATTGNTLWIYRLYGPGIDEPLAEYRSQGGLVAYLHRDGLGSITLGTNTSGQPVYRQSYTAFGARTVSNVASGVLPSRLSFTSRENSLGSLMQYRSRYYDTSTGRFLSQDSYRGNETSPPSLHRYTYVYNNPVNYSDPSGRRAWTPYDFTTVMVGSVLAAFVVLFSLLMVLIAFHCLFEEQNVAEVLGCAASILSIPLSGLKGIIGDVLEGIAEIAEFIILAVDGVFDVGLLVLALLGSLSVTALVILIPLWLVQDVKVNEIVAGIVMVGLAYMLGKLSTWMKERILELQRRRVW